MLFYLLCVYWICECQLRDAHSIFALIVCNFFFFFFLFFSLFHTDCWPLPPPSTLIHHAPHAPRPPLHVTIAALPLLIVELRCRHRRASVQCTHRRAYGIRSNSAWHRSICAPSAGAHTKPNTRCAAMNASNAACQPCTNVSSATIEPSTSTASSSTSNRCTRSGSCRTPDGQFCKLAFRIELF